MKTYFIGILFLLVLFLSCKEKSPSSHSASKTKKRLKTNQNAEFIKDTLYDYYKDGGIKRKGYIHKDKNTPNWFFYYDKEGNLEKKEEYKTSNDSLHLNQRIVYTNKAKIDSAKSWFFNLHIPDTLHLGKNWVYLDYHSTIKAEKRYLYIIVENRYGQNNMRQDTFLDPEGENRFGVFAYKKGPMKIKGNIIEEVEQYKKTPQVTIKKYKKYFEKEVYVVDSVGSSH